MFLNIQRALSKSCIAALLLATLSSATVNASFWEDDGERNLYNGFIYAYNLPDFGSENYRAAVKWTFEAFEKKTNKKLNPAEKHKVGLKIYTSSGDGLQTPQNLVRAVIAELKSRGYGENDIFILDATESKLREAGYLPPLSARQQDMFFEGTEVRCLDGGKWWSKTWFYDNPLPSDKDVEAGRKLLENSDALNDTNLRKSYLPAALIEDVDFWINLPVFQDSQAMELSGSLANATMWNISNRERFFSSPANAPVAMAEIAAIPEFIGNWALTIVSLEHYQIVGGPIFNSNYTRSEPVVISGSDPAILDAWAARRLNAYRNFMGFKPITDPPFAVSFSRMVGVGMSNADVIMWVTPEGAKLNPMLSNPNLIDDAAISKPRRDNGFFIPKVPLDNKRR